MDLATGEATATARHYSRHDAVFDGHLGAEGLEALHMLNNRAGANLAAAGQGHLGHAHAGK
jgi:hypothetical protein